MLIAQISDTHIVAKHKHWLDQPRTQIDRRLSQVIEYLNAAHKNLRKYMQ